MGKCCEERGEQIKAVEEKVAETSIKAENDLRDYDKQVQGGICLVTGLSWSMRGEYKYAWKYFIQGLECQNEYPNPLYADELVEMLDMLAYHKDFNWIDEEMRGKTIEVLGNSKSDKRVKTIEHYAKIAPYNPTEQ